MRDAHLNAAIEAVVSAALEEDRASEDVTTLAIVPEHEQGTGALVARESCVIAGLDVFASVFKQLADVEVAFNATEGDEVVSDSIVAEVFGPLGALLSGERVALNIVQRMCGIATLTRRFVELAGGVAIRDTRKTTPGLRLIEKAAVIAGGGSNHRMTLADQILIKDNHVIAAGGIAPAIQRARAKAPNAWLEIECDTLEQVEQAATLGADEILLDNMDEATMVAAIERIAGRCKTEASGGITLERIPAIAATGVDSISVGALTHSAPAIDLALEISHVRGS